MVFYSTKLRALTFNAYRNAASTSSEEISHTKRMRTEPHQMQLPTDSPSEHQLPPLINLVDRAKNLFRGKVEISEIASLFDKLMRNGHGDCVQWIIDELDSVLVAQLVTYIFRDIPVSKTMMVCLS